ncbi:LPS-assembly protein LptD [Idiomarina xiamenensis]|uniref:LPS-assembly protein LptD n=1 Tax=Idiomarina xiamenensis 10-D-4 TaxID=740709 RepID=K2KHL0_9GAMM|nr:LPS assembly protein LptD [Idiomarina xiamenensis]EKE87478.1 organic solvent tolerance protein OstA [Idiomarina xiamenensis 10-D-4]
MRLNPIASFLLLAGVGSVGHAETLTEQNVNRTEGGVCPVRTTPTLTLAPFPDLQPGTVGARADNVDVSYDQSVAHYRGNVELEYDGRRLLTQHATLNRDTGQIDAPGETTFTDGYVFVTSANFSLNANDNVAVLGSSAYQFSQQNARGEAQSLTLTETSVDLADATFTTCPADDPVWQLSAGEIRMNKDEGWGEAWHAKFELFGVPVLYVPYFNFPITDERKTGFLYPTFGSSSNNGFEVETPYYINIAPNMDATITPHYMSQRGLQLGGEYRYLSAEHQGQLNLEYLDDDKSLDSVNSRYLWHVEHEANWSQHWRGYVNATDISDDNYLNDFGSDFAGRADTHLYRHAQLDYSENDWNAQLRFEDYELIGQYRSPFRTIPQISVNYQPFVNDGLSYSFASQLSHFRNQDNSDEYATRLHVEPGFSYRVEQPAYDWIAEASYLVTRYQQQSPNENISDSVTRALPQLRFHGRLNFDRFFEHDGENYRQSLQPQIQYLFVPYEDQSDIGIYDTTLMQEDYYGLFRARRFSGLDRIAEANQITIGASTGIFNQHEQELMRFSLGQIFYLEDSRTRLLEDDSSAITSTNSELAAEASFYLGQRWSFSSAIQYDTELNLTRKSQTALEYRKDENNLFQVNHRVVTNLIGDNIEQVGMQGVWSLNNRWQVASNWYYDLSHKRTNDAIIGLQYSSCCWAVRFSAYRRINRNFEYMQNIGMLNQPEFDNGYSIQFMIRGLGGDNNSLLDMLQKSLFGYRRPFYLSN